MGKRFAIVIGVAAAGVMALGAQTAGANSEGRTEGDARAAFNAVAGGGFAIADNPGTHSGAPIGGIPSGTDGEVHNPEDVRIYFAGDRFSYCASGWHVIMLAWWVTESELVGSTEAVRVPGRRRHVLRLGRRPARRRTDCDQEVQH